MKFSLGFSVLALAADNQAPVISLDLSAMNCGACLNTGSRHVSNLGQNLVVDADHSAFADECEVSQNGGATCVEPEATLYDHHDTHLDAVSTSYILYVRAEPKTAYQSCSNTVNGQQCFTSAQYSNGIDFSLRSETVILYEGTDLSGNAAESLTFALILTDKQEPTCGADGTLPSCVLNRSGTMMNAYTHVEDFITGSELSIDYKDVCDSSGSLDSVKWVEDPKLTDLVDSYLTPTTSVWSTTLKIGNAEYKNDCGSDICVHPSAFSLASSEVTLDYTFSVDDYAQVFGKSNLNNRHTESGQLKLNDTSIPVIGPYVHIPAVYECMDNIVDSSPSMTYTDCFDDWAVTHGRSKNYLSVAFSGGVMASASGLNSGSALSDTVFCENNTSGCPITITYDVSDHFGIEAAQVSGSFTAYDTLEPTLSITMLLDASAVEVASDGEVCVGGITEATVHEDGPRTDGVHVHCKHAAHSGQFTTKTHTDQRHVTQYDRILDSTEIYHSAGDVPSYTAITSLTQEGTGYVCSDLCSDSTALTHNAEWSASCSIAGAGTPFDNNVVGIYYLRYSCNDVAGNTITACRTINNQDKTKPIITVIEQADSASGTLHEEASHTSNYIDPGATCSDTVDGILSSEIEVSGDVVNLAVIGTYIITYDCADSSGNSSQNHRTVVVGDRTCPICDLQGFTDGETITTEASFPYTESTVTCTDSFGSVDQTLPTTVVDVELTGEYVMSWSAADDSSNGPLTNVMGINCNSGTSVTKTVIVTDTLEPRLTMVYKGNEIHAAPQQLNPNLMVEEAASNGWVMGAIASAVSGVALLGYAASRKSAPSVAV